VRSGRLPEATVARLPVYLQALVAASEGDVATISSGGLARRSGVNSAIVRKDLSHLGAFGTRGVGYQVDGLIGEISGVLGLTTDRSIVIVGIGNLGRALSAYAGFDRRGFRIVGLLDADPAKVGTQVAGHRIEPVADLEQVVRDRDVSIAVLATPGQRAQAVAERLVAAGITAILNFAPVHLDMPGVVSVRQVDLSSELQILSFYEQLGSAAADERLSAGG
jgi:redox-sensing transcriptional repressor